jgi:Tfp pilus assembly protein FimV
MKVNTRRTSARTKAQRVGILVVAVVAITGFISGQAAGASGSAAQSAEHYSVHQGDTLWSIAGTVAPNQDPRDYVASLVELNRLETASLTPGQDLILPAH